METEHIPTLTAANEAVALMQQLAADHDWVSVFWDRGWGDHGETAEISVIVGGNGQQPKAYITPEVYKQLRADETIAENSLMTFKKRRLHDYKTPPVEESTGPNTTELGEQAVRRYLADHPEQPIVAEFYRGLERDRRGHPSIRKEYAETPSASGWFVLVLPGCAEVAISAQEPSFLGASIVGDAHVLAYPKRDGQVDVEALAGDEFQTQLADAIGAKLAVLNERQAVA